MNKVDNKLNSEHILKDIDENLLNNKWLKDILEVTYIYDNNFNITLFSDFAWLSKDTTHDVLFNITDKKLWDTINEIENLIDLINKSKSENGNEKIEIALWYLYYIKHILEITKIWLPFEIEKATWYVWTSSVDKKNRVSQIEQLEKLVFWWQVKDNIFETTKSYEYIQNVLTKNSEKISDNEFMIMNIILSKIKSLDSYDDSVLDKSKQKKTEYINTIPDIDISREDYMKIFKLVLEIYNIKKDVILSNTTNIYDANESIEIPNNDKYKTLKLESVLKMISHELETHFIILDNNEHLLWSIKWWWQLPREEWLAKIAEWILVWKSIDDFKNISFSLPEILAWEMLEQEEYEKFIDIYLKLVNKNNAYTTKDRILRRKRNYPLDYIWVQHKDTTYSRWLIQIIDYISQWWNWEDLYTAKVNFDDMNKAIIIRDEQHNHTKYPKLISEVILYKLNHKTLNQSDFLHVLSEKYKGFLSQDNISKVESLGYEQKKQLIEILNIINQTK